MTKIAIKEGGVNKRKKGELELRNNHQEEENHHQVGGSPRIK